MKKLLSFGAFLLLGLTVLVNAGCSSPEASAQVLAQNENFVYETFTQEKFDSLLGKEAFAVFIHSKSCGTCAKKNKEIIEDVEKFNSGTILKIEYDEAPQEFIKKYEVTKYDTFVTFSADGKWQTTKGANVEDVRSSL